MVVLAIPTRITNEKGEVIDGVIDFLAHHGDLIRGQNKILVDITYYDPGTFRTPTPPAPSKTLARRATPFAAFTPPAGATGTCTRAIWSSERPGSPWWTSTVRAVSRRSPSHVGCRS